MTINRELQPRRVPTYQTVSCNRRSLAATMKMYYELFLLGIYFHTLNANISIMELNAYSGQLNGGEGYIYPLPEECLKVLSTVAESAANLTRCSIHFARPIRLCENCIKEYVQFDANYQELLNTVVNGTSCRAIFISYDRLDAILEFHDSIINVWDKGNCGTCFDWSNKTPELLNSTIRFNKMFNDTKTCILTNYHQNGNNTEEVCQTCMEFYLQLDQYYKSLSFDAIGVDSVCIDIVDKMNVTRSVWSKTLNCCELRRSPEIIFLCCTGIISFLPILFYLAVRFCGPIRDLPNVLRQSRFKQSLLRSVDGAIN